MSATVTIRLDEDVKRGMESACKDMGLTMTSAFSLYAAKVARERRIPFEVSAAPTERGSARRMDAAYEDMTRGNAEIHELAEV